MKKKGVTKNRRAIQREIVRNLKGTYEMFHTLTEDIKNWLDAARGDLQTAVKLHEAFNPGEPASIHIIRNSVYHLQQAVEKAAKAVLAPVSRKEPNISPKQLGHKIHNVFKTLVKLSLDMVIEIEDKSIVLKKKGEECAELLISREYLEDIHNTLKTVLKDLERYENKDFKLTEEEVEKLVQNVNTAVREAERFRKEMERQLTTKESRYRELIRKRFVNTIYCLFKFKPQGDLKEAETRIEVSMNLGIDKLLYKLEDVKIHIGAAGMVLSSLTFLERYVYTRYPEEEEFWEIKGKGTKHPVWGSFDEIVAAIEFAIKEMECAISTLNEILLIIQNITTGGGEKNE